MTRVRSSPVMFNLHDPLGTLVIRLTDMGPAFDAISKKSGRDFDPATDEKITDGARGLYEKATG